MGIFDFFKRWKDKSNYENDSRFYHVDKEKGKDIAKKKKIPPTCQFKECNKKLTLTTYFFCKDCGKYHCNRHRIPEEHKCKGNPKNPHKGITSEGLEALKK
tara:strand:- start:10 stop:312 length:303 start_codon:yes stop_codon:yes gene_type:complete